MEWGSADWKAVSYTHLDVYKRQAPYLYGFCSETCTKISDAVDECYARETWEPMNPNEGKLYSISVYDISKLITESMKLFFSLNWSNKPEICHVYTIILKSFSDSLIRYTSRMEELVMEDLEDTSSGKDKGSSQLDKKDGWLFTEMKNALNSPNLWNKTSKTLQTLQRVRRDLREKNRPGSVSYTHLDVYKRQHQANVNSAIISTSYSYFAHPDTTPDRRYEKTGLCKVTPAQVKQCANFLSFRYTSILPTYFSTSTSTSTSTTITSTRTSIASQNVINE